MIQTFAILLIFQYYLGKSIGNSTLGLFLTFALVSSTCDARFNLCDLCFNSSRKNLNATFSKIITGLINYFDNFWIQMKSNLDPKVQTYLSVTVSNIMLDWWNATSLSSVGKYSNVDLYIRALLLKSAIAPTAY